MWERLNIDGTHPVASDLLKIKVNVGASSCAQSRSTMPGIESLPGALWGFTHPRSLQTSLILSSDGLETHEGVWRMRALGNH